MEENLSEIRQQINETDEKLASLFCKRMAAVRRISEYKRLHGLPVSDPQREAWILTQHAEQLPCQELRRYYIDFQKAVLAQSRAYQHYLANGARIAYSGIAGSFASIAAQQIFPDGTMVPTGDFRQAYEAAANGSCDYAVLPIENSYAGEVGQVMDLAMFGETLYINGIFALSVSQNLLGVPGAHLENVTRVISHEQALAQCADFISTHGLQPVGAVNTAVAAREVAEAGDKTVAAIASAETAQLYGLELLAQNINESGNNTTRFAVFSRVPIKPAPDEENICSILLFTVGNRAGALADAIGIIGSFGYNMRVLRSRPTKDQIWRDYFYIELEGNVETDAGHEMLQALSGCCSRLKVAGVFSENAVLPVYAYKKEDTGAHPKDRSSQLPEKPGMERG